MPNVQVKTRIASNSGALSPGSRRRMLSPRHIPTRVVIDTLSHAHGGLNRRMLAPVLQRKTTTLIGSMAKGGLSKGLSGVGAQPLLIADDLCLQRRSRQPVKPKRSVSCGIKPFADKNSSSECEKLIKIELYKDKPEFWDTSKETTSARPVSTVANAFRYRGASTREYRLGDFFSHYDEHGNVIPSLGEQEAIRRKKAVIVPTTQVRSTPWSPTVTETETEARASSYVAEHRRRSPSAQIVTALTPVPERARDLTEKTRRRQFENTRSASANPYPVNTDPSQTPLGLPKGEFTLIDGSPAPPGKRCHYTPAMYKIDPPQYKIPISRIQRLHSNNPNVRPSSVFTSENPIDSSSRLSTHQTTVSSRKHVIARPLTGSHISELIYGDSSEQISGLTPRREYQGYADVNHGNISPSVVPMPLERARTMQAPTPSPMHATTTVCAQDVMNIGHSPRRFQCRSPSRPVSGPQSIFV